MKDDKPEHINLPVKKFLITVTLLLSVVVSSLSQEIITLDESNPYQRIGKSIYYITDPKRELSFEEISSPSFERKYIKSEQVANNLGNVDISVWNKFTITNPTPVKWLLLIESYNIDTAEFYFPDSLSGKYQKIIAGRHLPFSARKYKTTSYAFDLPIEQGDTITFYLRVDGYYMQYPLAVTTQEMFVEESHLKDQLTGIYFGFVLVFMLYNFFVFLSVRDKSYLYYVVYIFFNALLIAQLKGLTAELFGDELHFLWEFAPAVIAVTSLFSFIFTRHILETRKRAPKWDKVIVWFFFPIYFLIIALSISGNNLYGSILNQLSGLLALFFLFSIAIKIYRGGFRPARYYIVACFFYFLGVLLYTLKGMNLLPFNFITNNSIEIGSTLQMIMFSFVIADRLKIFKQEKEKAQEDLVASLKENERLILGQKEMLEIKVKERTQELTLEKERSDSLLLNILPEETANELKEKGYAEPRFFESVTVLFTDFKDFTRLSEKLSPDQLVSEIDHCFKAFDIIVGKHDVEKIKTIGDSYMAAGGLPVQDKDHAKNVMKAAIDILQFIENHNAERKIKNQFPLDIRIGIHTGSVVAGIVGTKKFAYDIWGDAVNTASRMESSGEVGRINVSGATYELLKNEFTFEHRGKIEAKNKGMIDMYFLQT